MLLLKCILYGHYKWLVRLIQQGQVSVSVSAVTSSTQTETYFIPELGN